MAIIHYGKSVFPGNTRTRRHRRRKPLSRLKVSLDQALGLEVENFTLRRAERICLRPVITRVERAVTPPKTHLIDCHYDEKTRTVHRCRLSACFSE